MAESFAPESIPVGLRYPTAKKRLRSYGYDTEKVVKHTFLPDGWCRFVLEDGKTVEVGRNNEGKWGIR